MKERFQYLKIAEKWEHENKNWLPVELSHYFDDRKKFRERYITVPAMIDKIMDELMLQERFKNGRLFTSETVADKYNYMKKSLAKFVAKKCRMDFEKLQFRDMDEKFLKAYVINEMELGYKNGNRGGIENKLKTLRAVCAKAKDEGVYGVKLPAFIPLKKKVKNNFHTPKAISQETMRRIEQFDRTKLDKKENMYLDLFLFSYYAGGMSGIDICYMEHSWIKGDTIIYERIKEDKVAKVIIIDKAKAIIEKYRKEGYMNYLFPIFKLRKLTQTQMYTRVGNITYKVSLTLTKICRELGIQENVTWSSARSTFISKMLDDGYHAYQVAEMTGNSPATIYKYYYGITNREELKENMNENM
ncbi:integrase [uncultured Alistipes sp.]|uniref:integrase n=1 Tax=uncultured Alistipes sp. TaxID=538949 RepID=UPI0025DB05D1|nr:integrase [uncultured Alistipes sp.]